MKFIFKLLFVIRKYLEKVRNLYLINEYKYLYADRISISKSFNSFPFPTFHFDQSKSRLIIHDNVTIRGAVNFLFFNDGIIEIGMNTFINSNCSFNCLQSITIGANSLFGENVKIYDHNHQYRNTDILISEQGYNCAPIKIGSNCWIGSGVTILKGVTIGNNCVIGANCIVHKDVPSASIMYFDTSSQKTSSIKRNVSK